MTFLADLHCHSTCSDGSLSPAELVDLALATHLQGLSITDHDSIEAYPAIISYGQSKGISILPGVEFSAHHEKQSVHILAYSFDPTHPSILSLCKKHKERRQERNQLIIKNLQQEGFNISHEELNATHSAAIGRPHIARLLVEKGCVPDILTAFKLYLGDGKKCYAVGTPVSAIETLEVIHAARGLAMIAHPHLFRNHSFVKRLLQLPFDGIECYYARMRAEQNAPWVSLATSRQLLITGGSDFHTTAHALGSTTIAWNDFEPLLNHFHSHHPNSL